MISSLSTNNNSGFTAPYVVTTESFSQQALRTSTGGGTQHHREYSEVSSYRVLLSGHFADQNPTYTKPSLTTREASTQLAVEASGIEASGIEASGIERVEPLLDGAKNILSAIENRLIDEKAAGASKETLSELLQQGLAGFKQGYTEAESLLMGAGELNDHVANTITTLYQQVVDGLMLLEEKYIGSNSMSSDSISSDSISSDNNGSDISAREVESSDIGAIRHLEDGLFGPQAYSAPVNTVEYGRKDSFAFELMTVDGDKISITASNIATFYGEYDSVNTGFIEATSSEGQFSFEVEGELDAQELQAIEELLGQIMVLSDEFYNGDINRAYETAINLGYNQNEITSYALRLHQVEQYSVAATYQTFLPEEDRLPLDHRAIFSAIGNYASEIIETLGNPYNSEIFDYSELLTTISEQFDKQVVREPSPSFHDVIDGIVSEYGSR